MKTLREQGAQAYKDGSTLKDNPCTPEHAKEWVIGWRVAQSEAWREQCQSATSYDIYGGDRP